MHLAELSPLSSQAGPSASGREFANPGPCQSDGPPPAERNLASLQSHVRLARLHHEGMTIQMQLTLAKHVLYSCRFVEAWFLGSRLAYSKKTMTHLSSSIYFMRWSPLSKCQWALTFQHAFQIFIPCLWDLCNNHNHNKKTAQLGLPHCQWRSSAQICWVQVSTLELPNEWRNLGAVDRDQTSVQLCFFKAFPKKDWKMSNVFLHFVPMVFQMSEVFQSFSAELRHPTFRSFRWICVVDIVSKSCFRIPAKEASGHLFLMGHKRSQVVCFFFSFWLMDLLGFMLGKQVGSLSMSVLFLRSPLRLAPLSGSERTFPWRLPEWLPYLPLSSTWGTAHIHCVLHSLL